MKDKKDFLLSEYLKHLKTDQSRWIHKRKQSKELEGGID